MSTASNAQFPNRQDANDKVPLPLRNDTFLGVSEARSMKPTVVHVDEQNRIVGRGNDSGEPVPGAVDQKRAVPAA